MIYDLIVVGGGPAGLAAALSAWEAGLRRILILERDRELGGILNQCIHNGFGLHYFQEELTGPEYAGRFVRLLRETDIQVLSDAMVLNIGDGDVLRVQTVDPIMGCRELSTRTVILAMGCRERTRGAIGTPGNRPAGILTAGAAQRYLNIEGCLVGRRAVILGSGDIGLIMARRMTLEGAKVLACLEVMPYSGGMTRNLVQCLEDFGIPLYLSHTVTEIQGRNRLERVLAARVDENRRPVPGTEIAFDCDTLLLSVGLIPENELTRQAGIEIDRRTGGPVVWENMETSKRGVFACGNVVHVHDLVDFVTMESRRAGAAAARYVLEGPAAGEEGALELSNGEGVSYTVPQRIHKVNGNARQNEKAEIFFRVNRVCGKSQILVEDGEGNRLAAFRRERMAPGEMERMTLPAALLERAAGGRLTVSVREEKGADVQ